MICKLEIYNGELNLFPVVTNERVFAQITMGNIVKGQPGKSPIIGENDNWWVYNNETGELVLTVVYNSISYYLSITFNQKSLEYVERGIRYNTPVLTGNIVVDHLGSSDKQAPLSANQGRILSSAMLLSRKLTIQAIFMVNGNPVTGAGQRGTSGGTVISRISTLTQAGYTLEEVLRNTILTYPKTSNSSGQVYTLNCSQVIKISNTEYQLYFPVHKVSQVDGKNQVVVSYVNVATILKPSEQIGWVIGNVQVFSNEDPFVN